MEAGRVEAGTVALRRSSLANQEMKCFRLLATSTANRRASGLHTGEVCDDGIIISLPTQLPQSSCYQSLSHLGRVQDWADVTCSANHHFTDGGMKTEQGLERLEVGSQELARNWKAGCCCCCLTTRQHGRTWTRLATMVLHQCPRRRSSRRRVT